METKTHTNGRGETATTDGLRVWRGTDTDETTMKMEALQPIESVYPDCAPSERDARLHQIAVDCILDRAPSIQPEDDERESFRAMWGVVQSLKGEYDLKAIPLAFSNELGVYARNVVYGVKPRMQCAYLLTFCGGWICDVRSPRRFSDAFPFAGFPPKGMDDMALASLRTSMQMCVLAVGKYAPCVIGHPAACTDGGRSVGLDDVTAAAALMIALRSRTAWYAGWYKNLPF